MEDSEQDVIFEKVFDLANEIKVYRIKSLDMGLFSARGRVGKPIITESGQRLELMWKGIVPRYELLYFRGENDKKPRVIGSCDFRGGCNECRFYALDSNRNEIPDSFIKVEWVSRDGCEKGPERSKKEIIYVFYPRFEALFVCKDGICLLDQEDSKKDTGFYPLSSP